MDTTWMALGYCNDKPPSLFFPSDGVGVEVAPVAGTGAAFAAGELEDGLGDVDVGGQLGHL